MWFDSSLDEVWENGFKAALKQVGYNPIRVDLTEHNEKICDRIIAEVRKSGLVVADFTGQRGGVYFEAGFAMGLGIPVIWSCRDTDVKELHFDTRQYNHIVWTDPADLKKKLINRIEATLPIRPSKGLLKA
jgi:nucleoside 2-deoxyribosyltransferase